MGVDANDEVTLVLTVFKGENFVCKTSEAQKCQIFAKLKDHEITSTVTSILPSNTEPVFDSQMSWTFTKKELSLLRSSKAAVKAECRLIDDVKQVCTTIGEFVVNVRDAFQCEDPNQIRESSAKKVLLKGTKEPWRVYQPKLLIMLHVEDKNYMTQKTSTKATESRRPRVSNDKKSKINSQEVPSNCSKPEAVKIVQEPLAVQKHRMFDYRDPFLRGQYNLPVDPLAAYSELKWRTNSEIGCFELGEPSADDDLYTIDTTIVSCKYLHLLWDGKTSRDNPPEYVWKVSFRSYGTEIPCGPFLLSTEDPVSRKTSIGYRFTARVRANGAAFNQYLEDCPMEFRVVRVPADQSIRAKEQIMGLSYVNLNGLTEPGKDTIRVNLGLACDLSQAPPEIKPEVLVLIQVQAIPAFFSKSLMAESQLIENLRMDDEVVPEPLDNKYANIRNSQDNDDDDSDHFIYKTESLEELNVTSVKNLDHFNQTLSHGTNSRVSPENERIISKISSTSNQMNEVSDSVKTVNQRVSPETSRHLLEEGGEDTVDQVDLVKKITDLGKAAERLNLMTSSIEKQGVQYVEDNEHHETHESQNRKVDYTEKDQCKAYLKLLSDEWQSRDKERELLFSKKTADLRKKELELTKESQRLKEKEAALMLADQELKNTKRKMEFDQKNIIEMSKVNIQRLQEKYRLEMEMQQRRIADGDAYQEKLKGQVQYLERKLEVKGEEVKHLESARNQTMDSTVLDKMKDLQLEVKLLSIKLREAEEKRDEYRHQASRLAKELSTIRAKNSEALVHENNTLRLHLLATKEQNEMKKEHGDLREINEAITNLGKKKRTTLPIRNADCESSEMQTDAQLLLDKHKSLGNPAGDSKQSRQKERSHPHDREISRLVNKTRDLINSGAYTPYDSVIKEMQSKMKAMARKAKTVP